MSAPSRPETQRPRSVASPWALKIATVSGIPIRIHFTFVLFLVWVAWTGHSATWVGFVLALFGCIVLHELGHALTAQHFAIQTRDITLYPIGGVATLDGRPKAKDEFWIALAGPAVNVLIAILLATFLFITDHKLPPFSLTLDARTSFLQALFIANLILPLFNMIPAFPMDGGRVLRSVLAMNMPERRATRIAATIGQGLAIVLGFVGLFTGGIGLMLVAFFVFLGAGQESSYAANRSFIDGHRVADAMMTKFLTIETGQTLDQAAQLLLAGAQQDFPVVLGEQVHGLLTRGAIARGIAGEGPGAYVSGHMIREPRILTPDTPLEQVVQLFSGDSSPVLVMEGDHLAGMLTGENLGEFIMLEAARHSAGHQH